MSVFLRSSLDRPTGPSGFHPVDHVRILLVDLSLRDADE